MKLCECGCDGEVTKPGNKFINGHNNRKYPIPEPQLCECGCGGYTEPGNRFIDGHYLRLKANNPMNNPESARKARDNQKKTQEIDKFVEENTNKHLCKCGCGGYIVIQREHSRYGIPDYIHGHHVRVNNPMKNPKLLKILTVLNKAKVDKKNIEINKFIEDNKGKYFCHCGCDEEIIITRSHYYDGIPDYIQGHYIRVNHPMKRPEIVAKISGDNNHMKTPESKAAASKRNKEIMPGVMQRPDVKKNQLDGVRLWHKDNPEQSKINTIKAAIASCKSQDGKPSSIEFKIRKILTDNNYQFTTNIPLLNLCIPDIVFKTEKVIIQCDGDYWHDYPNGTDKDYTQDKILKQNGWQVIRFWEHEINNDIDGCLERFQWETFRRFNI